MSLELCAKVALSNSQKGATNLRGLRIKDGAVMATDTVNIIKSFGDIPNEKIDCYVDAKNLQEALDSPGKEFTITMLGDGEVVRVEKGTRVKIDLQTLDLDNFRGADIDEEPEGEEVEPKDFLAAVQKVAPLLKQNDRAKAYYVNGYVYASDGNFLVRTPTQAKFPEGDDIEPVSISRQFADLLKQVKKDPIKILVSENMITVVYDTLWISSARLGKIPGQFESYFEQLKDITCTELPEDVFSSIKYMCSLATDKDKVIFTPMGISLSQDGKINWTISHPMPYFQIKATWLKTIFENSNKFNFDNQRRVVFDGDNLEGVWGTAPSGPEDKANADPDEEEGQEVEEEEEAEEEDAEMEEALTG